MSELPDGAPPGADVVDRGYLVPPEDEVYADPRNPGFADPRFLQKLPEMRSISVQLNMQPFLEKVNKAVLANDMDEVCRLWGSAKFGVNRKNDFLVEVELT